MCVCVWRLEADTGHLPVRIFTLVSEPGSLIDPGAHDFASMIEQQTLGIHPSALPGLEEGTAVPGSLLWVCCAQVYPVALLCPLSPVALP